MPRPAALAGIFRTFFADVTDTHTTKNAQLNDSDHLLIHHILI